MHEPVVSSPLPCSIQVTCGVVTIKTVRIGSSNASKENRASDYYHYRFSTATILFSAALAATKAMCFQGPKQIWDQVHFPVKSWIIENKLKREEKNAI